MQVGMHGDALAQASRNILGRRLLDNLLNREIFPAGMPAVQHRGCDPYFVSYS
jgi:hypothetical protein